MYIAASDCTYLKAYPFSLAKVISTYGKRKLFGYQSQLKIQLYGNCVQFYARLSKNGFVFVLGETFNQTESVWQFASAAFSCWHISSAYQTLAKFELLFRIPDKSRLQVCKIDNKMKLSVLS